ncbi:UNVERIFIED_CONTAM: hypothetical protein GTU68_019458 [Idotea baltica]|nr:hypothetical protein [Idotea baltica]
MTGERECFDVVVLTMPVPQILGLTGQIKEIIQSNSSLLEQLNSVEYSSRFALGLFYNKDSKIALSDGSSAQYVTNNPAIRFIAIDNMKRRRGSYDSCPSVILHTSVPFGKANLEKSPGAMQHILLSKLNEMYPEWPEPEFVKCHKWRYSQVSSAFPGLPGAVKIGEGLIAGGDGFTHSNMDGCIESAQAVVEQVLQHVSASE